LSNAPDIAVATAPPPAAEVRFAEPSELRSRDIFRLLARAWPFVRPYKRHLLYLLLAIIPTLPAGLLALMLIRVLFDVVGQGKPLTPGEAHLLLLQVGASRQVVLMRACIASAAMIMVGMPIAMFLFGYAVWILQRISNLFRVNLYARLQELSLRFHSEEKIGDAIFRMFQDSAAIPQVISGLVIQPLRFVPYAIANFFWLLMYSYPMALIAGCLMPIEFAFAWTYSGKMRRKFLAEREATSLATTRIEETLASIKAVKAFGCEAPESLRYADDNWSAFLAARSARLLLARYRVLTNLARGLAYCGAIYFGVEQVLHGGSSGLTNAVVSLGLFQGAMAVFGRLSVRVRALANQWGSLQDVGVAVSRVLEMLAKPVEERVASGDELPPPSPHTLRFERVSFGYDPRAPVLQEVSFEATAGEMIAIAGPSGSGKSTIIALLLRFFDPVSGAISLDRTPIERFDLAAWRGVVSVALQDSPMFTATLRANVAYGRPAATDSEIFGALAIAGLGDFVRSLPAGLDTMIGEKGSKISAGQAQRIGLARAIVRDAPILMLDEPTSALDAATEDAVMRGVRAWLEERPDRRIVLVATHRRTTAASADRIYRITGGRVAQEALAALEPPMVQEA
jgi:ATP-binding cassette, subfamily B, bacterial